MAVFTETFKRKEMKYVLNAAQLQHMREVLCERMMPDEFGRTTVRSVYFDTPERSLIARSVEKPLYKEKLRVRCYDANAGVSANVGASANADANVNADASSTPQATPQIVFTEMKKKFKGIVYKRRVGTSAAAAHAWATGMPYAQACNTFPLADEAAQKEALSECSLQIAREIDAMRARHGNLTEAALIECERTAYINPETELRITFDEHLRGADMLGSAGAFPLSRVCDPAPNIPSPSTRAANATPANNSRTNGLRIIPLTPAGYAIMEVKSAGPLPLWLVHAMNECGARPSSFSKYGKLYELTCPPALQKGAAA